jgi:transposase
MFDHYIALDWAQSNMAIGRMTKESSQVKVINVPAKLEELKLYLGRLKGKKILTFEETTTSQWLYVELKDYVDSILICDPYRNALLSEGAKTDELDAEKLARLLRANMLKPVFHSGDELITLRKIESGYEDLVKLGVRLKNQRSALFRAQGKAKRKEVLEDTASIFVIHGLDKQIESYEIEKKRYETKMESCRKKHFVMQCLDQIPGIGLIGALKIAARVVDAKRFTDQGHWLSYCGLVRCEKQSGGVSYGWRMPRYCRTLKSVFKTAAISVIVSGGKNNPLRDYYEFLLSEKRYAEHNARHALARRIAVIALGVMKSDKAYEAKRITKEKTIAA